MCNNKVLATGEHGIVSVCLSCGKIYFAYGTLATTLDERQFIELFDRIHGISIDLEKNPGLKAYWLPVNNPAVCLLLNAHEVREIQQMAEQGKQHLELMSILHDACIHTQD